MNTVVPSRAAETPPGVSGLTLVELRKMTDTRSGFRLLLSTIALTVAVAVVACLVFPADERNLLNFVAISLAPASILLPVAGILLVTSERSQGTAMITFALVPARSRVLTAKLLAGLALAASLSCCARSWDCSSPPSPAPAPTARRRGRCRRA
jgi:ABC-2 type transport system permease protein